MILVFLISFNLYAQDALLQAIYGNWLPKEEKTEESSYSEDYKSSDEEADYYSWNLGTPDNIPETIIIYDKSCSCY